MKLFWVSMPGGYENWFVVVNSESEAVSFFEIEEGLNDGDATAKFICYISDAIKCEFKLKKADWPTHELLEALGLKITSECNPRKVYFNGKIYIEGTFSERMFFDDIRTATGVYFIKIQNTNKFKIGKTVNIINRIKQLSTANPENIKLVYFIKTDHYKSLEQHFHNLFKEDRIAGEWFVFDDAKLTEVEENIALLQYKASSLFRVYNIKAVSILGRVY